MFFSYHPTKFLALAGTVLAVSVVPSPACGPDFPNAYLASPGESLAALPTLCFAAELDRLLPSGSPRSEPSQTQNTELMEVREVLAATGLSRRKIETAVAGFSRENPPAALPPEFQLYTRGARAWHGDRPAEALVAWRELLALPPEHRHYRTTWAAYMIGRTLWDSDGELARASFQQVREAAAHGFADGENLAVASLGWEARVHLRQENYAEALRLYFRQYAAGDPGALNSLQLTLQKIFQRSDEIEAGGAAPNATRWEEGLRSIASDQTLRGVVTAWFSSRGGPRAPWSLRATRHFRQWLAALPKSEALGAAEADRWAWTSYQNGQWAEAGAFAKLAPASAPVSEWVRAMLLLREGDLAAAADHLTGATRGFPEDPALNSKLFLGDDTRFESTHEDLPDRALSGVRGALALQREQFSEALRLLLHAGHWADAAYVAERVLTVDELTLFVRDEVPTQPAPVQSNPWWSPDTRAATATRDLRHLLARRLTRAGQFDRARDYFPADLRPVFDSYVQDVRTGYREDLPARERAQALWRAAHLAKDHGMELQGTELAPDYAITDGNFEWPNTGQVRHTDKAYLGRSRWYGLPQPAGLAALNAATDAELDRNARQHPPTKRYHYRQRAAQLAWLAATLLPDNDDRTALILNTAGRWIAPRYPEDADLYYKTLVFRCSQTALGREAAAKHWFVPPATESARPENPVPAL